MKGGRKREDLGRGGVRERREGEVWGRGGRVRCGGEEEGEGTNILWL